MTSIRSTLVLATLVAVLSAVLCTFAYGADEAPAPAPAAAPAPAPAPAVDIKVGVVDIDRVRAEYVEVKNAADVIEAMRASLGDNLQLRTRHRLLATPELDELVKLVAIDKPAENDTKRRQELEKKSSDQAQLLATLQAKKDLTEPEKTSLKDLSDLGTKADTALAALRGQYLKDIETKEKELGDTSTQKMLDSVTKLAQQKGLGMVISKDLVLFGGQDLTTELLTILNGNAKKP